MKKLIVKRKFYENKSDMWWNTRKVFYELYYSNDVKQCYKSLNNCFGRWIGRKKFEKDHLLTKQSAISYFCITTLDYMLLK